MKQMVEKAFMNELIIEMKRKSFDYFEKAIMIDHLIKEVSKTKEYGCDKGRVADYVARTIGVTRKELYRIKSVLKANKQTKQLLINGAISGDKVSRILYNLKDKSKEDEVVMMAIQQQLNSNMLEKEISEINCPTKIGDHVIRDIEKFNSFLDRYCMKVDKLEGKHKVKLIEIVADTIEKLKRFIS